MKENNLEIVPMVHEDLDFVHLIEKETFEEPWTKKMLKDGFEANKSYQAFCLKLDQEIVGYYFARHLFGESELDKIALHPSRQGQGLGRKLFQHFLDQGRKEGSETFFLEVATDNERAFALYSSAGFKVIKIRLRYHPKTGKDAYLMKYTINTGKGEL